MIGSHVPRLAAVIAGTLAMPAPAVCGDDEIDVSAWPQELQYGTRDSAGITIVESRRPESGSRLGWAVGDEPAVSIGTMEATAAYQLYRVADATRLADGRVVPRESLGRGIQASRSGRGRQGMDGLRPRRAGPGLRGDARGPQYLRDRSGLPAGPRDGRTRCRDHSDVELDPTGLRPGGSSNKLRAVISRLGHAGRDPRPLKQVVQLRHHIGSDLVQLLLCGPGFFPDPRHSAALVVRRPRE